PPPPPPRGRARRSLPAPPAAASGSGTPSASCCARGGPGARCPPGLGQRRRAASRCPVAESRRGSPAEWWPRPGRPAHRCTRPRRRRASRLPPSSSRSLLASATDTMGGGALHGNPEHLRRDRLGRLSRVDYVVLVGGSAGEVEIALPHPAMEDDVLPLHAVGRVPRPGLAVAAGLR